jgi:hypothetical protein
MIRGIRIKCLAASVGVLCLCVFFLCNGDVLGDQVALMPKMPAHWIVISDFQVPAEQVQSMSSKLGTELSSVRNTVYDVNGKRVQINVIATPDNSSAEKLMATLRPIKTQETLLRKGLIVYEFVGQNDVLPLIAEGREQLDSR